MMDPNIATMATSDEDDTTCPNLPKSTRTICYFIQAIVGVILIVPSIIPGYGLIIGIILLLTSSLWVMKPSKLWKKLIEPVRFISFILLIGVIVLFFVTESKVVGYVCTGVAFWYFLSFIPGAQEFVKNCVCNCYKSCSKNKSEGETLV